MQIEVKHKIYPKLFPIISFLIFGGIFVWNYVKNSCFWNAQVIDIISPIFIAFYFSYYLIERKNDERRQKEILEEILWRLKDFIEQEEMYNLSQQEPATILMRSRQVSNQITILNNWKKHFNVEKEVDFICEKFEEYNSIIGNHIDDLNYLEKSSKELERPIKLISDKILELTMNLYT